MLDKNRKITPYLNFRGQAVPSFLYGTAWKEAQTESLTLQALEAGFKGIDTANQRKHYFEAAVGQAVQKAINQGLIKRSELFLQSKFTYAAGQDQRLPYDPQAAYSTQVRQSFASTLAHFDTDYLDSYLLHGPASGQGLLPSDLEIWRTMEALQQSGAIRLIGVSNMRYEQLASLLQQAEIKPAFVQNRCYARTGWDVRVRQLCLQQGILYQGFSLLTANQFELSQAEIQSLTRKHQCSLPQLVFRFALQLGMLPLTGTSSPEHMREDLAVYDFELSPAELDLIEQIAS